MSKRFHRGLVVGKFSPLHHGHEFLINRALAECEEVLVISYSKPEMPGCEAVRRDQWFAALYPNVRHLAVTDERLREWVKPGEGPREVPCNDADETTHRRFCGFLCWHALHVAVQAVFTSEDYGDGFARELTTYFQSHQPSASVVHHVMVDLQRQHVPVSGTMLRQNIHACRNWLSPIVYSSFVQRVCLLGGESTGKSTLACALGSEFGTQYVPEYGRDLWEMKQGKLCFEDMRHIGEVQIQRENEALIRATEFLFCDTSPLTTLFYSNHLFGKVDPVLEQLSERAYAFTILCAPDFAFVQDGTRQPESFRLHQHEWYRTELARRGIPYLQVTGPIADRIRQIRKAIIRD